MSEPREIGKRPLPDERRLGVLDPSSPSGTAIRTAAAATGAMAIAFALHLEVPALAVVFALARGSAGAITMLVGALAGSAAGLVLLDVLDQSRIAFSIALFVLTAAGTYGALGRRFPYAWVQALLCLLVLVGQALDTPGTAVRHAFFNIADVLVAAAASFVTGAASPAAAPMLLQDALARQMRELARLLERGADAPPSAVLALERGGRRTRHLLASTWPTRLASRARFDALASCTTLVEHTHDAVLILLAGVRLGPWGRRGGGAGDALVTTLVEAAARVRAPRGPIDGYRMRLGAESRTTVRGWGRAPAHELRHATAPGLRRASPRDGGALSRAVARAARRALARVVLLSPSILPGTRALPNLAARVPRDAPLSALDPYRLRHSVKSAASYLLVLWAWVASGWGAIVPALVVSVLVATLATPVGATLHKALLRVGGVLAGGLAGLLVAVVLLPGVSGLPAICAVAGGFLLAFQWIQQRSERLMFASLQAAIAFVLTLVHGTAPPTSWRDPLESLIGLAFGIVVVVGVMHAAWPIDATSSAHATLADLLELSGRRLEAILGRTGPGDTGATSRARAAARRARDHAVGFVHEVELYGTQFGRPAEDLARLARPALELDAVVSFLESLPDTAGTRHRTSRTDARAAVHRDLRRLAECVRALPGEPAPCDEHDLTLPSCLPADIGSPPPADGTVLDEGCALVAALARDVTRALRPGQRGRAPRAA